MRNTDFDVMTTTKNALLLPLPFLLLMVVLIMLNDLSHFAVFSIYSCVSVLLFYCHAVDS